MGDGPGQGFLYLHDMGRQPVRAVLGSHCPGPALPRGGLSPRQASSQLWPAGPEARSPSPMAVLGCLIKSLGVPFFPVQLQSGAWEPAVASAELQYGPLPALPASPSRNTLRASRPPAHLLLTLACPRYLPPPGASKGPPHTSGREVPSRA